MSHTQNSPILTPEEARNDPRYFAGKISKNPFYASLREGGSLHHTVIEVGLRKFLIFSKLDALMGRAG